MRVFLTNIKLSKDVWIRWSEFLKPDGIVIVNNYEIPSLPIAIGKAEYPQGILEELQKNFKTIVIDAGKAALELGNIKT